MADAITGSTQLAAVKDQLLLNLVLKEIARQSKLLSFVQDVTSFGIVGYDTIKFPSLPSLTAIDKDCENPNDATTATFATEDLPLDKKGYVALKLTDCCELETPLNVEARYSERAATALSRYVDAKIAVEIEAVAEDIGGPGAVLNRDNILAMREYLKCNFAENLVMLVDCSEETTMLKIDEFTRADVFGRPVNFTGEIGQVYGVPVISCPGLKTAAGGGKGVYMMSRDALVVGFQKRLGFSSQPCNEYGADARRLAWDNKFGVKGLYIDAGTASLGKSAWVAKLEA